MTPLTAEDTFSKVRGVISGGARLGVSDFARSREWRGQLAEQGIVEVVDRTDTVGYVLSPEYVQALTEFVDQLEEELEQAHIRMMLDQRRDYSDPSSGEQLSVAAKAHLKEKSAKIREFLDGDER